MRRSWKIMLAALVVWGGLGTPFAAAQWQGGYQPPIGQQPPVSPYLNINRFGQPPGLNYYNMIRPQVQTQQQLMALQNQQHALSSALVGPGGTIASPDQPQPTSITGHPVNYFDWSRYFPIQGLPVGTGVAGGAAGFGLGQPGFGNPGLRSSSTPNVGLILR